MTSLPDFHLLNISGLLGRLHPALVHLPIGILLLCCLIHLLAGHKRFPSLQAAVPVLLFWGMVSAISRDVAVDERNSCQISRDSQGRLE